MMDFPLIRRNRKRDSLLDLVNLDSVFDDFFRSPLKFSLAPYITSPSVDVFEKGNDIVVKAELPGAKPEEIDISVDGKILTVSGEKKQESDVKEDDYYRLERSYGKFQRTLELASEVRGKDARAKYKNGVLEITLPKSETERKKRIKIEVNN